MLHVHGTLFADLHAAAAIDTLSQIDLEYVNRSMCNAVRWTTICTLAAPGAFGGGNNRSGSENRVIRKIAGAVVKGLLRGWVKERRFQALASKAIPLSLLN